MTQVQSRAQHLQQGLIALSDRYQLGEVRGEGLLLALQTGNRNAAEISQACYGKGLLINAPRPDTLRFMPALNVTEDCIQTALDTLNNVLALPA